VNTSNFVTSGEHELTRQRTAADHRVCRFPVLPGHRQTVRHRVRCRGADHGWTQRIYRPGRRRLYLWWTNDSNIASLPTI